MQDWRTLKSGRERYGYQEASTLASVLDYFMNHAWQNLTVNYVFSEYLKYFIIKIVFTLNMSLRKLSLFSIHYYWCKNTNNEIITIFGPF